MGLGQSQPEAPQHHKNAQPDGGFRLIPDQYRTFDDLSAALKRMGFENCDVVLAIDFTGSNREQGKRTFGGKDLHWPHEALRQPPPRPANPPPYAPSATPPYPASVSSYASLGGEGHVGQPGEAKVDSSGPIPARNPYQTVISAMSTALETLCPANRIHVLGFGDTLTEDHSVFCVKRRALGEKKEAVVKDIMTDCIPCSGVDDVMHAYEACLPHTTKSGPTSFVPVIDKVIERVKKARKYCFLFIIGDGDVTNKAENAAAVVRASNYPISISFIGVGDGPWDAMREFDDELPNRRFDNWQSVDYDTKMKECDNNPLRFAVLALQEAPDQLAAIKRLRLL